MNLKLFQDAQVAMVINMKIFQLVVLSSKTPLVMNFKSNFTIELHLYYYIINNYDLDFFHV